MRSPKHPGAPLALALAATALALLGGCGTPAGSDAGADAPARADGPARGDAPASPDVPPGFDAPTPPPGDAGMDAPVPPGDAPVPPPDVVLPPSDAAIIPPGDPGAGDVRFTVHSQMQVAPISRYIYGWNGPNWTSGRGATLSRMGGNRLTAYNWENNASNAGSDYMFQNDNLLCSTAGCSAPGEATRRTVTDTFSHGASIVLTVPMAGYVAADTLGGGDVRRSGTNYLMTRFRVSVPRKGSAFTLTPDTSDANVYQDEYVNWVETTFPMARRDAQRTIFYCLDNEPDLWSSTHAEIHPMAATYAEMARKTTDLATAIKAVVPDALVFGPVSYGWQGYVNLQNAPDAMGRDFIEFYLDSVRTASTTAGRRLVDVLDLHWYPEAQGGGVRVTDSNATAPVAAARVQAPRSLWDPTYTETSWITACCSGGPIRLLPRMRDKIAMHYPGTRIAITEYNYGGGGDISGGIAQADVLGIFGREGVFAAAVWSLASSEPYIYAGLEMFRNYNGADGAFGDTSILGSTTDVARTSVYASVDAASPGRMVLVAINKTGGALTAAISVSHTVRFGHAEVYQLTSAAPSPHRAADVPITAVNAFRYAMPANSVTTLVLLP